MVRKEAKAHGLQRRVEGPDIAGRRVLVVEDTTTTGGTGAGEKIEAEGVPYRFLYSLQDLGLG